MTAQVLSELLLETKDEKGGRWRFGSARRWRALYGLVSRFRGERAATGFSSASRATPGSLHSGKEFSAPLS